LANNIEIKAYLQKTDALRARVEELAEGGPVTLVQEDVFFDSAAGRLKLRKSSGGAELIYYERPDDKAPVESQYMKTAVVAGEIEAILSIALGVRGTVRKRRDLYRIGQTRVHVDEVEGLGSFVELEVELGRGQSATEGEAIARDLMKELGVKEGDLVAEAYIDLLEIPQAPAAD
jgi:predicted adenylyl cyclase CyaB